MAVFLHYVLMAVVICDVEGGTRDKFTPPERPKKQMKSQLKPLFYNVAQTKVESVIGSTVYLVCSVKQLEDRSISWIRKHDLHILTVGTYTYTKDSRFQCLHDNGSNEWLLKIMNVQFNDSGVYDCQINTEPKLSLSFSLSVYEARTEILGNDEIYLKTGSVLTLTCIMEPPYVAIKWFKDGDVISESLIQNTLGSSVLKIAKADFTHSGKYACAGDNVKEDYVTLHLIKGEQQAAIHHSSSTKQTVSKNLSNLLLFLTFLLT